MNWRIFNDRLLEVIEFIFYFLITIVALCSLGVWLPFAADKAQSDVISKKSLTALPWNLITYSVAIVMISFIDRLRYLFKITNKYKKNEREFLILLIILFIGGILMYFALVNSRFNRLDDSIVYACLFTILAWMVWIYVKLKNPSYDNFSTLGGEM